MAFILCYTKPGIGTYPDHNYPGHVALNCDWEHAMHLAISEDGKHFKPLRNNTGVLFPKGTFDEGPAQGTTKTLIDPWLFRAADGGFRVCAVRRNQNAPDPLSTGCAMLFASKDLARYEENGFLKLAEGEIRHPRCRYDAGKDAYRIQWMTDEGAFCGVTADFRSIAEVAPCAPYLEEAPDYGIEGCVPGNVLGISDEEARVARMYLDEIANVGVAPIACRVPVGASPDGIALPKAVCLYSDGSTHEKPVDWDRDALKTALAAGAGRYAIPGRVRRKRWPFPIPLNWGGHKGPDIGDPNMGAGMSDPCVTLYRGKYYLSSSGRETILLRCADTIEGTFAAEPVVVHTIPLKPGEKHTGTWAAELHEIDGVLYMFTGVCPGGEWTRVQSHVLRCNGDPMDPASWEAPRLCVKPNGKPLTEGGISLDMTWFRDGGRDYVMWSDRKIRYGTDPLEIEPADIYICTVDPKAPWQATSEPRCVVRPMYGWDRYETEVDEGPYLLRHGDDLFVTISGSSTGMGDLYDLGLLRAKTGTDLLDAANWDWLPYPLLTKESVPGEYGPGHNNFVVDPETGDDLMVYHAIPHDANDRTLHRRPAIRRVHWAATGLPYLEMTPERDLAPEYEQVTMALTVE